MAWRYYVTSGGLRQQYPRTNPLWLSILRGNVGGARRGCLCGVWVRWEIEMVRGEFQRFVRRTAEAA